MYIGNKEDYEIFQTTSYSKKEGGFTEAIVNEEKLKKFQEFCRKENIKRQDYCQEIKENEYHIFEPYNMICGCEKTCKKIHEHFKTNLPLQMVAMEYKK